jgi:hypothetical protein
MEANKAYENLVASLIWSHNRFHLCDLKSLKTWSEGFYPMTDYVPSRQEKKIKN